MLVRLLGTLLSPEGARGALSILIFHRVLSRPDPIFPDEPDAQRFDAMLSWIGKAFNVMPLDRAVAALAEGRLPARAAAITFDDGYADNYSVALPILQKHGLSATFFVAADYLDGGRMFNDTVIEAVRAYAGDTLDLTHLGLGCFEVRTPAARRTAIQGLLSAIKYLPSKTRSKQAAAIGATVDVALPDDLMMTSGQLRALRAGGMVIGGHTCSHPILAGIEDAVAYREIAEGKQRLESILREPISLFAFPNGKPGKDYLAKHVRMVREAGFDAAVSTAIGAARRDADFFQLPRFTPWDKTALRFGLRLVDNMRTTVKVAA
ncbi:MAG: polysaccharide deacetylase family protein [Zoogloeaceae bacterium]|nr:polysaccharide deacetylase family protein [Zoogloeaceae bacterium]